MEKFKAAFRANAYYGYKSEIGRDESDDDRDFNNDIVAFDRPSFRRERSSSGKFRETGTRFGTEERRRCARRIRSAESFRV